MSQASARPPEPPIRVLLVDDHTLFRRAIARLFEAAPEIAVVGEAADGDEAIAQAAALTPDVILMDVRMPRVSGLTATRTILRAQPTTRIIMLTTVEDEDSVFEAVKQGAHGYLLKAGDPEELFTAVRGVVRGEAALAPGLAAKVLRELARQAASPPEPTPPRPALSPREQAVLTYLAAGQSNKEIATALSLAENTVKNHVKNILAKLHLANRVQAAVFALQADGESETTTGGPPVI